jgi:hypothetical protein
MTPTERMAVACAELTEMHSVLFLLKGSIEDMADGIVTDDGERLNGVAQVLNLLLGQIRNISDLFEI